MHFKYMLITLISLFILTSCSEDTYTSSSASNDTQAISMDESNFSPNKKKFVSSTCKGDLPLDSCICMYDSIDPKLSQKFGNDWMNKGMKDLDYWNSVINEAMLTCGLEYKSE